MIMAIVVAYNAFDELNACLTSLSRCAIDQVIVVDNSYYIAGSCVDRIAEWDSERFTHIVPDRNLGYAGGNNAGIRSALEVGADTVLVCNPDIVLESDVLDGLIEELASRNLGLISPFMIESGAGSVSTSIARRPGWDTWVGRGMVDVAAGFADTRVYSTFFGACFAVRASVLRTVGGLSEDFFLYCEEADYCRRLAEHGIRWAISERFGVNHARGASILGGAAKGRSAVSLKHAARSTVVLGRKYWRKRVAVWSALRVGYAGWLLFRGRFPEARAVATGTAEGWAARIGMADIGLS